MNSDSEVGGLDDMRVADVVSALSYSHAMPAVLGWKRIWWYPWSKWTSIGEASAQRILA